MKLFGFFGMPRQGKSDGLANSCGLAIHLRWFWETLEGSRMRISITSTVKIVGVVEVMAAIAAESTGLPHRFGRIGGEQGGPVR
jgi:hypothetical protein